MSLSIERRGYVLPSAAEAEQEIFALGDIHGRTDLLAALIDEAGREPRGLKNRVIVFLGDLIDRGPDNLGAIELATAAATRIGADQRIALMGNHEAMMRLALDPAEPWDIAKEALECWIANGGERTLAEFLKFDAAPTDLEGLLAAARASLPGSVLGWLRSLRANWRSGGLLFVHAGVNPDVELEAFLAAPWDIPLSKLDEDRHWAWVRRPFLAHRPGRGGFSGYLVIHGHTPNDARRDPRHEDQIAGFRLNLDAGSVLTGVAKMAIVRGARAEVVTVRG